MKRAIKTLFAGLCAVLVLSLSGCSKNYEDLIVGKWNAVSADMTTTVSGMGEEYDGTETDTQNFEEGDASFTFNEDGSFESYSVGDEEEGPSTTKGTYTVKDDQLTLNVEGGKQLFTIKKLDKKELVLENHEHLDYGEGSVDMDITLKMKKA